MEPSSPTASVAGQPQLPQMKGNASGEQLSSSPGSAQTGNSSTGPSSDAAEQNVLRHPKGKRKRTAAKDKAILEAAYQANPKPDKTARLDIVSQVSLNEKEVQIWFQNRRQNDRRKSRPLSAQEIAALRFGGIHALSSSDPPMSFSVHTPARPSGPCSDGSNVSSPPHCPQVSTASMVGVPVMPSTTPLSSPELGPWTADALARKRAEEQQQQQQQQQHFAQEQTTPRSDGIHTPSAPHSFSSSVGSVGYLANRWNMHSSFSTPSSFGSNNSPSQEDPNASTTTTTQAANAINNATPVLPPLTAQKPSQQQENHHHPRPFRLSLSLEGKAEVIASQSPSPQRPAASQQQPMPVPMSMPMTSLQRRNSSNIDNAEGPALPAIRRSGSLQRSQSAILSGSSLTLPPISSLTGSLAAGSGSPPVQTAAAPVHPPRLLRGRSRDVHNWESVCDAETRVDDELSAQAQHEASGSAIAAISLIRSTSNSASAAAAAHSPNNTTTSILQPNSTKRNTPTRMGGSRLAGGPRPGAKRTKLGRTTSSVARMQSVPWSDERGKLSKLQPQPQHEAWAVDEEKKKKLKLSTLLSNGDSDKENWSPDEEGRPMQPAGSVGGVRRPLPSGRSHKSMDAGRSFQANYKTTPGMLATRHHGHAASKSASFDGLDIYEDRSQHSNDSRESSVDAGSRRLPLPVPMASLPRAATLPGADDVERFMRGDMVSPSKKGDLDCVAGLLSLSQGAWR